MNWLNRDEVCEKSRLCYTTIWRRLRTGTFPRGRNVCGKILWKENEIDAWLEAQPRQVLKGDGGGASLRYTGLYLPRYGLKC